MTGENQNNQPQEEWVLNSNIPNGDIQWGPNTWVNEEGDQPLDNNQEPNQEDSQDNNDIDKYSEFLNEVGQTHISKMMDDYEKVSEMIEDKEVLSKLSKEDIIKLYQTEAQLKTELDNILPILESQKTSEVDNLLSWLDDSPLKEYISDLAEDAESPEEIAVLIDMAKKMYELAGGKAPESNPEWNGDIKWDIASDKNNVNVNSVDPVQGMFSTDPKVRGAASDAMDKLLTDMLSKQYWS